MHTTNVALLLVTGMAFAACADSRRHEPNEPSSVANVARVKTPERAPVDDASHPATSQADFRNEQHVTSTPTTTVRPDSDEQARAAFTSAHGYELRGEAEFTKVTQGVEVRVAVNGAPPGVKGVHIHQKPDCSDIPNNSMGAHFSPPVQDLGYLTEAEYHLGDLGSLRVGADGAGELKVVVPKANLKDADTHSFLTHSIVVHDAYDTAEAATGQGSKPIACGIIDR